ncbi:MAG TPA: substrate-binding domain-containing protein [Planctomycetaceae bacterium]|nr:substrate-binding domain-containing protein [Planctomycetaceae bacterium]
MRRILLAAIVLGAGSCRPAVDQTDSLTLATTTSTRDSGLLDVLVPVFEQETGLRVKVVAVGSGQALELGRRGDADVLLTHAPEAERRFMAEGFGEKRGDVMHNDFVLVGPDHDPAGVRGETSITQAFRRISETGSRFVSRGDESGTHLKEQQIWSEAAVEHGGDWYLSAGTGMAEALRLASHKRAYTLSDRGTWLSQRARLELAVLVEGDALLRNPYAVIVVNPARHPQVHAGAARRFAEFLLSPPARKIIREFGVREFGEPLFFVSDEPAD